MWIVKPAIALGLLYYFTRSAAAATDSTSSCPPGTVYIPFIGCAGFSTTTKGDQSGDVGGTIQVSNADGSDPTPITPIASDPPVTTSQREIRVLAKANRAAVPLLPARKWQLPVYGSG